MLKKLKTLIALFLLLSSFAQAQESFDFLPDKPGKWVLNTYSFNSGDAFHQNVKTLAEWFRQKVPIMANPKGFDLEVDLSGYWNDKYSLQPCNYGRRGELNFNFQLFSSKGGKWTVEPPHWSFEINNTEEGHPRLTHNVDFDNTKDPPSLEKPLNKAAADLNDLFMIFPFKREIAPGVRLYGPNLIVFNPDRPPFWIPVTVREIANMKLAYYSLIEVHLLPYLKDDIAKLTENELNAFAYSGNEKLFVLGVHPEMEDKDKEEGGKIMRFNPDYWDRSLPPTAIQIMSFYYPERSQAETDDFFKYNGYPIFGDIIMNSIKPGDLAGLIMRKK